MTSIIDITHLLSDVQVEHRPVAAGLWSLRTDGQGYG